MHDLDLAITRAIDDVEWPTLGLIRLAVAAFCGGLVGLEREIRGRQAGFRTNVLVCVGCSIVMLVSIRMAHMEWPVGAHLNLDPARIAYGVMTGIGFLGAGVIIRHEANVRGLTTAAGIWCVAGIGLACGMGLYLFALIATLLVVAVLWVFDLFERMLPRTHYRTVTIRRSWKDGCVSRTVHAIRDAGYKVPNWTFRRIGDLQNVEIKVVVGFYSKHQFDSLESHLPHESGAELVAVESQ